MKVILELPQDKWDFISPILEKYVITEEYSNYLKEKVNFYDIESLYHGSRIVNALKYELEVETVEDLLNVTEHDFLSCRNVGKKSWNALVEYIEWLELNHLQDKE